MAQTLAQHSSFETEIAQLIIDTLNLEEVTAAEIEPNQPLFREGLGLDSIDALELSLALSQRYGCQLRSDDVENVRIFASLRSLSAYVEQHRTR